MIMFRIQVNNGAVMRTQMKKEIGKVSARDELSSRLKSEKAKATGEWYRTRINQVDAARNAKAYQKDYDRVAPESLSPETKSAMVKRAKELKDIFSVGMLSKEELHPMKTIYVNGSTKNVWDEQKTNDLNAVKRNKAWYDKNRPLIDEYKNIMRHLFPDDPTAGDIERFRVVKRGIN